MPPYWQGTANRPLTFIKPGDSQVVWSAETPLTGTKSQAVALDPGRLEGEQRISIEVAYSADPGAGTVDLQTADTDTDAAYVTEVGATIPYANLNGSFYGRQEFAVKARFARLLMTLQASNAGTVTAKISR